MKWMDEWLSFISLPHRSSREVLCRQYSNDVKIMKQLSNESPKKHSKADIKPSNQHSEH